MKTSIRWLGLAVVLGLAWTCWAGAGEPFRYPESQHGQGELRWINDLPILIVTGENEAIGQQIGALALRHAQRLPHYPKDLLRAFKMDWSWPTLLGMGKRMLPQIPEAYRKEMQALAEASGVDHDLLIAGNTFFDIKKMFACSAILVEPDRSQTGQVLFGRNLDFPSMGYLHHYSLVTVYRPGGKLAHVSVGFPGMVGCLTGMNEKGLCLAINEVYSGGDRSPTFDAKGIPYAICLRQMLEECSSVSEAIAFLSKQPRTTCYNLSIADREQVGVLEVTTKHVVFRPAQAGICTATNHFLSRELALPQQNNIYDTLERLSKLDGFRSHGKLGLKDVAQALHEANLAHHTLQTIVFEPSRLTMHVAFGQTPSSAMPLKAIDCKPLFQPQPQEVTPKKKG